ncbi:MAG: 16S rRNA (cytosine(967)-C(5))-methyltransferase RsmB [Arenicellales bacterium WSBS_2016_MAG_OTU3]
MADFKPAAALRACAAVAVYQVVAHGKSLNDAIDYALESVFREVDKVPPNDRSLLNEIVQGTLRWFIKYQSMALAGMLKKPKAKDFDIVCLLAVGFYQIEHTRIPDHAAVAETVAAVNVLNKSWARGLVNAITRGFLREHDITKIKDAADEHAFPAWLFSTLKKHWPQEFVKIAQASNQRPPMSLRVNLSKSSRDDYKNLLEKAGKSSTEGSFSNSAIVLDKPVAVETLPGFAQGAVSVQDESAQLATEVLQPQPGQRVLDACAAPGGKTIHILEATNGNAKVTAIDKDSRIDLIQNNLTRCGFKAAVIAADASEPETWWDEKSYDRILIDAPCSGTGVIRRHPDIKHLRRGSDITQYAALQCKLLNALAPLLSDDGQLLYCTCSILPAENEKVVARFLRSNGAYESVELPEACGREKTVGRQRVTGEHNADGFYYALLRRKQ